MATAANDSKLPSLSSPVPPCGNNSQRYRDGFLQFFWPKSAIAAGFGIKGSIRNSYVGDTINHPQTLPENTPNMATATNDSKLPSLSFPVPPCGNNSQRYRDGFLLFFWPKSASGSRRNRQTQTRRVDDASCHYIANK
jgi:hypothetical protein